MTTIATDGSLMAADGQTTHADKVINSRTRKLHRLPDGSVIGESGDADIGVKAVEALARALEQGCEPPTFKGDYALLRLTPEGKAFLYWEKLLPVEVQPPAAIGSGGPLARAAMLAGAGPVEAVRIAKKLDVNTGGRIHTLKPRP